MRLTSITEILTPDVNQAEDDLFHFSIAPR